MPLGVYGSRIMAAFFGHFDQEALRLRARLAQLNFPALHILLDQYVVLLGGEVLQDDPLRSQSLTDDILKFSAFLEHLRRFGVGRAWLRR